MQAKLVRETWENLASNRGRIGQHALLGFGVAAAAVAAAALIARAAEDDLPETYTDYDDPDAPAPVVGQPKLLAAIWPPVLMAMTVSGLRIWNAPASRARTRALSLWGIGQTLNAAWMALGARRLGGGLAAAVASLTTAAAYMLRARRVEPKGTETTAPFAGWLAVASAQGRDAMQASTSQATVH